MSKYIHADKLIAEIKRLDEKYRTIRVNGKLQEAREADFVIKVLHNLSITITSLQQEQPIDGGTFDVDAAFDTREPRDNWEYIKEFCNKFGRIPKDMDELDELVSYVMVKKQKEQQSKMVQWTGKNLKEVIDFTGKSPRFNEWFKSWEELENYVHTHNNILKLFCEDGSHYEVPKGAWIVKTPDGYNVPSVSRFIHAKQEQPEVDLDFQVFAKEMDAVFNLPKEMTENTEENPLNWEYAIARHFYELARQKYEK